MAVCKVPATDMEALKSNLMGLFEKKRLVGFYNYIENVELDKPETWKDVDLKTMLMKDLYKKYKLGDQTIDFLGHAVALFVNDDYQEKPAFDAIEKM